MGIARELTTEDRERAREAAIRARRERAELKSLIRLGRLTIGDALADPRARRLRVVDILRCMPGVGPVKTNRIMMDLGIARSRRVRGLGQRQKAGLTDLFGEGGLT